MARGVRWYLVGSVVLVGLGILAGCSHYMLAEREPWRHEAELTCLNSGAANDTAGRVRIAAIEGPGACGIDYPLRVSALGESAPLAYEDEPTPPGAIPNASMPRASMPRSWPGASPSIQSNTLPPLQQSGASQSYPAAQPYPSSQPYRPPQSHPAPLPTAQAGAPLSISPPGLPDDDIGIPGGPPHPYYGGPSAPISTPAPQALPPGPPYSPPLAGKGREGVASAVPVQVQPPATLACPVMSALDQWIAGAVQPAAAHWFRQPVVEIKQISAYSCRGMNGNPNAHISEHAFGNALDIAEFDLADGHKISVQYGWHGTPEEQGFLHDVQAAACDQFTTVLAPGANVYHYNHIHVDLMRHYNGRHICEPSAIPGEVVAARARAHYAAQHYGNHFSGSGITGSIKTGMRGHERGGEGDDSLPAAVPGDD